MVQCHYCGQATAVLKRPKTLASVCKPCFLTSFEEEVHATIMAESLFTRGERVAIAASGGKDSTVLAHVLTTLNKRHDYGLDLFLLSVDEGIAGYRDDSLESVKRNQVDYGLPLRIVSYRDLYGWSMDEIVAQIGRKSNCTFCGVFRRQALDRGAQLERADKLATGHNADDLAETVLMNMLRGDHARLERCTAAMTGRSGPLPRAKPFKYAYEKEIVMYAYYKSLDYFSTECIYAPNAYRGFAREFLKNLEKVKSRSIIDIVRSGEHFIMHTHEEEEGASTNAGAAKGKSKKGNKSNGKAANRAEAPDAAASGSSSAAAASSASTSADATASPLPVPSVPSSSSSGAAFVRKQLGRCERCDYISSNRICKACVLLEGLNKGRAKLQAELQQSLDTVPTRGEFSSTIGRSSTHQQHGPLKSESEEKHQTPDSTQPSSSPSSSVSSSPMPSASPPSSSSSASKRDRDRDLSATMAIARKLDSTSW